MVYSIDNHAAFINRLDTLTIRVDQSHILPIKHVEILIMKAWALTEPLMPRLKGLRYCGISHGLIHSFADPLHQLKVGQLNKTLLFLNGERSSLPLFSGFERLPAPYCECLGPAIHHQVFRDLKPVDDSVEVIDSLPLPAWCQSSGPSWISRTIVPPVDCCWRTLEYK